MGSSYDRFQVRNLTAQGRSGRPAHHGSRFDDSGRFLPEKGNTFVAHVASGSKSEQVLADVREHLMGLDYAHHFAFTPASSLHMTLAQGVIDNRRREHYWPADLSLDAPVEDTTQHYLQRLPTVDPSGTYSIRAQQMTPYGLGVEGATEEDRQTLQAWREVLSDCLGYRHPDHEDYAFHITMAYLVDWLPDEAVELYESEMDHCLELVVSQLPRIELSEVAFCTFEDMNHFEPVYVFQS